jgi:SAM-dependent methyltransferase
MTSTPHTRANPPTRAQGALLDRSNRMNPCAGPFGSIYDFYIERERLSTLVGGVVWGVDNGLLYRSLDVVRSVPANATIVDVPCGGGVALRALEPAQRVRYLAFDLDERMVSRAARRADSLGLAQVEVARADAAALPVERDAADLVLSHGGLHCFADPTRAIEEYARVLKPGGRLLGTAFVAPGGLRQRLLFAGERRRSGLPALWSERELREELTRAGIGDVGITTSSGLALFEGTMPRRRFARPARSHNGQVAA